MCSSDLGSSAINLGKDSGVNLGQKSQTSVSTGGIGVTQEIGNIGGVSISGGLAVEIIPIDIDISGNPNYEDPSKSTISIGGGAEIPGGILGIGGGVTINTSTGAIEGGSIGGEAVGIGIDISKSSEGVGVGFSLQIPFTPIEISLGFEFPSDEKKEPISTPTPPSTPNIGFPAEDIIDQIDDNKCYHIVILPHMSLSEQFHWPGTPNIFVRASLPNEPWGQGIWINNQTRFSPGFFISRKLEKVRTPGYIESHTPPSDATWRPAIAATYKANFKGYAIINDSPQVLTPDGFEYRERVQPPFARTDTGQGIKDYIKNWRRPGDIWDVSVYEIPCNSSKKISPPRRIVPLNFLTFPPSFPSFPNPPPRKKMDECCKESIKLLRQIHKGLGISKFPGQLPVTIIQQGKNPGEPAQEPIADFVDLLTWMFKRDDERWGQWQIEIEVKDSDLTKEGNQSKTIKFPNLAESIAEMEGQMLSILTNVEALVALQVKTLAESGIGRQEAMKGYLASKAIIKYFAIKTVEKDFPHPLTYTPGAGSIDELIQESEGHVVGIDYEEKETLRDIFADLLQAAAIIRAVHWQKIDTKTSTKGQLLDLLKGSVELANKIGTPGVKISENGDKFDPSKDWEDFLDEVEDGFTNSTGIADLQNPYGKTRDRRPRIRQIGDNIAQAGGQE